MRQMELYQGLLEPYPGLRESLRRPENPSGKKEQKADKQAGKQRETGDWG